MSKISRRTMVQGAAWSAPVIAASAAVPAAAQSPEPPAPKVPLDYGLFVSTSVNAGNSGAVLAGYTGSNQNAGGGPTTPQAYFASNPRPESDLSWSDSRSKPANSQLYVNGEGSFTPVTNSPTGNGGSYTSTSGFWFSVPTTAPGTGAGYVAGSRATLASGAVFTTDVKAVVPSGARWSLDNITLGGRPWNGTKSGSVNHTPSSATYLQVGQTAGNWKASAPKISTNSDGDLVLTAKITFTTTESVALTLSGSKYYGQVLIMPNAIQMFTSYGWESFSLTSYVSSASISYSGGGNSGTLAVPPLTTTSTINP